MNVSDSVVIESSVQDVWAVYADVERWPEWTESVTSVEFVDGASLQVGAVAAIKQPRLPRARWTVVALDAGRSWTWLARSAGATTTATHLLHERAPGRTQVTLTIEQRGILGSLVGRLVRSRTRRYLAMEAAGLKRRVEADGAST